ncbi:MAG: hypothetical protein KDA32_10190 [Phycisphaerales bacterium]|nr:hypothetical protein [Phycisphaerales bacterium]
MRHCDCSASNRFAGSDASILIWDEVDQADWFVRAADAEALGRALRVIWGWDEMGNRLCDCTPAGAAALAKLKPLR